MRPLPDLDLLTIPSVKNATSWIVPGDEIPLDSL